MARAAQIRIDTSDAILDELVSVLRDDFNWTGYRLHAIREQIAKLCNVVTPTKTLHVISDEPDNRIVECAEAAGSAYIISEDKHLLKVGQYQGIKILRVADFLREVQPGRER